jgi:transposase
MNSTTTTTIGLDLAKNIFQVHGANAQGKQVFNKPIKREKLAEFFQLQPPCVVAMEACASAHHWARLIRSMGHEVRLIAPQHVKPYVQGNKHDAADAAAICEAATRPRMRFVAIKTIEQQAQLCLHRARQGFVKQRTAQANQIRGLLAEYGLIVPQGISHITSRVPELIEDASNHLPGLFRILIDSLIEHLKLLQDKIAALERHIRSACKAPVERQLQTIPGIGPISASALVAGIGDVSVFKNGRELAAWLGLVPAQRSSGGKTHMKGISKRGDSYLRNLLVHGARSVICASQKKHKRKVSHQGQMGEAGQVGQMGQVGQGAGVLQGTTALCTPNQPSTVLAAGQDPGSMQAGGAVDQGGGMGVPALSQKPTWLQGMLERKHINVATVALAARNARIVWAVLKTGRNYEPGYVDARFAKAQAKAPGHKPL